MPDTNMYRYGKVEFVQKRHKLDSEFILKGDKSVSAVKVWVDGLLEREEFSGLIIPNEVQEWFLEAVFGAYNKAENDLIKRMILVKIIHTLEVVKAGFEISRAEHQVTWNENQVGTACMLHDVGRFDQALLGSYSDEKTGFDHAKEGASLIERSHSLDFEKIGIDRMSVLESVKNHSNFEYLGGDMYAKLTRDADKLALLRALPEIMAAKLGGFEDKGVTEAALQAYKKGEGVMRRDMNTRADLLLAWLSWENDFNFPETKRLFEKEGLKEWMLSRLTSILGVEVL